MSNITSLNQIGILWQKLKNKKKHNLNKLLTGADHHFTLRF